MILNPDVSRIHAVISVTLIIVLMSFTCDRYVAIVRVEFLTNLIETSSRSSCDLIQFEFFFFAMNLSSSLANGTGARSARNSVPWPSTFPGRKGLTDCCFSLCVAPGARIDPVVRAHHSAASATPPRPCNPSPSPPPTFNSLFLHHRYYHHRRAARAVNISTVCLLDLYLSTLSMSPSGSISLATSYLQIYSRYTDIPTQLFTRFRR